MIGQRVKKRARRDVRWKPERKGINEEVDAHY